MTPAGCRGRSHLLCGPLREYSVRCPPGLRLRKLATIKAGGGPSREASTDSRGQGRGGGVSLASWRGFSEQRSAPRGPRAHQGELISYPLGADSHAFVGYSFGPPAAGRAHLYLELN